MLFHTFNSQEERRSFGGSAFIEIQFCRLPAGTEIKKLTASDSIEHWQDDSLYVADESVFYQKYSHIFDCGTYNNLKTGTVDIYGINYYAPSLTESIIERLQRDKPEGYEVLTAWLTESRVYNGFYILGI